MSNISWREMRRGKRAEGDVYKLEFTPMFGQQYVSAKLTWLLCKFWVQTKIQIYYNTNIWRTVATKIAMLFRVIDLKQFCQFCASLVCVICDIFIGPESDHWLCFGPALWVAFDLVPSEVSSFLLTGQRVRGEAVLIRSWAERVTPLSSSKIIWCNKVLVF